MTLGATVGDKCDSRDAEAEENALAIATSLALGAVGLMTTSQLLLLPYFAYVFDFLAPIHGSFTEGFDLPDLEESKSLLDGLRV